MQEKRVHLWVRSALIFLLFFIPTLDTDLGWHLRYGEHFLSTGTLLRQNTLTYFLSDYSWAHPYTLYQVLTALVYRAGGLFMLSFSLGLLAATTYFVFEKLNPRLTWINLVGFLAITAFGWNVFHLGWRAQIFTFVGLVLTLYLLKKLQEHSQRFFLLLLLFALWANFHGGFVSGLVIFGAATLNAVSRQNWTSTRNLAIATVVAATAAVANPYGLQNYYWIIDHAKVPLQNLIAEWVSPPTWIRVGAVAAALSALALVFKYKRDRLVFWLINLGFFTTLVWDAKRATPLFGLVLILALFDSLPQLAKLAQSTQARKPVLAAIYLVAILVAFWQVPKTFDINTNWKSYCQKGQVAFPCRAVEYIQAKPLSGKNVYSAYEWGGFLEWQLPQYKFFVDGRMPAWATPEKKSPYTIYLEIIQAKPGWEEQLNTYGTDWLLIGNGTFLDIELTNRQERSWQEIYRDNVAVIYKK